MQLWNRQWRWANEGNNSWLSKSHYLEHIVPTEGLWSTGLGQSVFFQDIIVVSPVMVKKQKQLCTIKESVPLWLLREVIRRLGQLFYFQAHGNSYEWRKDQVLYDFLVHLPSICFLINSDSDWLFSSIFHRLQQAMRPTFVWFLQLELLNRSHWYQNFPYHAFCLTLGTISCILWRIFANITKLFFHGGECNIVARRHLKNTRLSLPYNTTTSKYTYMIKEYFLLCTYWLYNLIIWEHENSHYIPGFYRLQCNNHSNYIFIILLGEWKG